MVEPTLIVEIFGYHLIGVRLCTCNLSRNKIPSSPSGATYSAPRITFFLFIGDDSVPTFLLEMATGRQLREYFLPKKRTNIIL